MKQSIKYMIIISRAKNRILNPEIYTETHHIIPKCCGGTNDKSNLVKLLPEEHYNAHKELALSNPDIPGLQYAWFKMCTKCSNGKERDYEVTAEEYAEAKKRISPITIERNKLRKKSDEEKNKIRKAHIGMSPTIESRIKHSKKIRCIDTNIIYYSIREAVRETGTNRESLSGCLNGKYKTAGKMRWEFI